MTTTAPRPRATTQRQTRRPSRGQRAFLLLLVFLSSGTILWLALWDTRTRLPGPAFNRGENAVWLGHTWVADEHSDAEVATLAATLTAHQIRYVFAHVGPLDADGTIPASRAPRAVEFAAALKRHAPDLVLLAWIGQVEARGNGILNLNDAATRSRVATTAGRFAALPNWDGVHYDIEPLFDDDRRFLALLDETRPHLGGRLLSLATPKWFPGRRWDRVTQRAGTAVWSTGYYHDVAARVDQLAVMTYDSALPWDQAYSLLVKQQTTNILWAVRDTRAQVLIGVPVYHENSRGFRDYAENMTSGLRGIRLGLNNADPTALPRFGGVAIYPYWEIHSDDWTVYDRTWLGR